MDLYYDNQKIAALPIEPTYTIGQVKQILSDWLTPQGVTKYTIKLVFNNGSELSSAVFDSNAYDASNFQAQANLLNGGAIYVNTIPVPVVSPAPVLSQTTVALPTAEIPTETAPAVTTVGVKYTRAQLEGMKAADLKEILKANNQKMSGNKGELVERILSGEVKKARGKKTVTFAEPVTTTTTFTAEVTTPTITTVTTGGAKYTRAQLEGMKAADLKEILKANNQKMSGNKSELVERILSGEIKKPRGKAKATTVPPTGALSPMKPLPPMGQLTVPTTPTITEETITIGQLPPMPVLNIPEIGTPEIGTPEIDGNVLFVVKYGHEDYLGFRNKADALRWWIEDHFLADGGDLEDLGLADPVNYDDEDELNLIEQAMSEYDETNQLIEVPMAD